jgi:hypothetical protein
MNNLIRSPQVFAPPAPGTRDGNWVWDGSNWVCDPDCMNPPPCPPMGPPVFSGPAGQPPWYPGANGGVSFGATPPPNPVRGHLWWNGLTFYLFDGAAWVPIGGAQGGSVTPPAGSPPANPVPGQQWFNGSTLYVWDGNAWIPVSTTKTYIQATAPPAPNPGDMWWDGVQFRIWDGSAWELVGPGAIVGPVPTSTNVFTLSQPTDIAGLNTTANPYSIVNFTGTPQVDTQNAYDPVTHKVTPKVPGMYMYQGRFPNFTGGGFAIVKNDSGSFAAPGGVQPNLVIAIVSESTGGFLQTIGTTPMNGTTDFVRMFAWAVDGVFHATGGNYAFSALLLP